jgi:hypothetical protein
VFIPSEVVTCSTPVTAVGIYGCFIVRVVEMTVIWSVSEYFAHPPRAKWASSSYLRSWIYRLAFMTSCRQMVENGSEARTIPWSGDILSPDHYPFCQNDVDRGGFSSIHSVIND